MTDFSNKVINKIKSSEIKPKPKWTFKFKELSRWTALLMFVLFLGLVSALLWYFIADINIRLGLLFKCPLAVSYGPGLIIVSIIIITLLSIVGIRHIKGSYRYNLILISSLFIMLALILAVVFTHLGYGQRLDKTFSSIAIYQSQEQFMGLVWQQPDQGRIAGEIVRLESSTTFNLKDVNGEEWLVSSLGAIWRHNLSPEVGLRVKMEGVKTSDFVFKASDVRPWKSGNASCLKVQNSKDTNYCKIRR